MASNITFEKALAECKAGKKIIRKSWNDNTSYVVCRDIEFGVDVIKDKFLCRIDPRDKISIYAWNPKQADFFADDWITL